ncbi:hypothetical protein [Chitinophaga deserti]|uniref:hypothetical protein n=1 Tax=Chitinophaga deserti TaxID=2164099 RepID=UPI000D6AC12D|nr:hypothetical protein [Chitinophaga deserti]
MMVSKENLFELGFTGFERLRKSERDGKERLVWYGLLHGVSTVVVVVNNDSVLELEKLSSEDQYHLSKLLEHFSSNPALNEVVTAIKEHGILGGIEP